MNQRFSIMK